MKKVVFTLSLLLTFPLSHPPAIARAQVRLGARVISPVSAESPVIFKKKSVVILPRDDKGVALPDKRISLRGDIQRELTSDSTGSVSVRFSPSKDIQIFSIIADREVLLGTFAIKPASDNFLERIFFKKARAQVALSIEPAQISLKVAGGDNYQAKLKVTNNSPAEQTFEVSLKDYISLGSSQSGVQFLPASSQADSLAPFVDISPLRLQLNAGEQRDITLNIAPGAKLTKGKYKGAVVVNTLAPTDVATNKTALGLSAKVGSLVGVEVIGQKSANSGKIQHFNQRITWSFLFSVIIILGLLMRAYLVFKSKRGVRKSGKKAL